MKTLDEKAAEYAASVVSCNKEAKECEGLIQTAYILGATTEGELLREETGTFGQALESLKRGHMFIFMRPADELHIGFVAKDIKSLPQKVKDYYYQDCVDENGNPIELEKDDTVKFTAYICMKAADGSIVNGWLASQTDMLANDWMIFEF